MKFLPSFPILFILVAAFVITISVKGQTWKGDEALRSVPDEERARLSERLRRLIEYQSAEQWEKVYELLPNPKNETKDRYASGHSKRKTTKLEAFIPRNAAFIPTSNAWAITGCATFRENRIVRETPALTYAVKQDGEWYLYPIGIFAKKEQKEPYALKLCSQ
jgi:hypothetical protein